MIHTADFMGAAAAACLIAGGLSAPAFAGPCSDQIQQISKTLSDKPALGPVTTGTLTGATPKAGLKTAGSTPAVPAGADDAKLQGTSAGNKLGGEGGTKEMNAASNEVATSSQDVRRQQAGMPTMAADPNTKLSGSDDRMSQAKTELAQARALDADNNQACEASVKKIEKLLQKG